MNHHLGLWTGICLCVLCSAIAGECRASENLAPAESAVQAEQGKALSDEAIIKEKYPNAIRTSSGLMYVVVKEGEGESPYRGAIVEAHYTGRFLDGRKFDSSVDRGQRFHFTVGKGQVIRGWDEAFLSMKKGEKRILIVPPHLAYGERGAGPIPPNATLIFEVEFFDFL